MGQELSVAASQTVFDRHVEKAQNYAVAHECHVWACDFRVCAGNPQDWRESLVLPEAEEEVRRDRQPLLGSPQSVFPGRQAEQYWLVFL